MKTQQVKLPVEVYSRICGYYRPVYNWNPGKREEYRERRELHFIKKAEERRINNA